MLWPLTPGIDFIEADILMAQESRSLGKTDGEVQIVRWPFQNGLIAPSLPRQFVRVLAYVNSARNRRSADSIQGACYQNRVKGGVATVRSNAAAS